MPDQQPSPPYWPVQLATLRIESQGAPHGRTELKMLIGCDARRDPTSLEWIATNGEGYRGTGLTAPEAVLECLRNHALGRTPLPVDPAMTDVQRCKLCDTTTVFKIAGVKMEFAPHRDDPTFCRDMTIGRIQTLERVIAQQSEEVARATHEASETRRQFRDLRRSALDALDDADPSAAVIRTAALAQGIK